MIGQELAGRYRVMDVLSSGVFGQTYLAQDTQASDANQCIIRQLRLHSKNSRTREFLRRLLDKRVEALKTLGTHDQIPDVIDSFDEGENIYLVEAFIPGQPLTEELLPHQPLPEAQVIDLMQQITEILDFIHGHRVIHQCVQPSTIIRRKPDNKLVLTGSGALREISAQLLRSNPEQAEPKALVHSSAYMAPEQIQGEPQFSSDFYALGMLAIQALTGFPPAMLVRLRSMNTASQNGKSLNHSEDATSDQGHEDMTWHGQLEVSAALVALIDKLIEPDYSKRYQSAKSILVDLQQIVTDQQAAEAQAASQPESPAKEKAVLEAKEKTPEKDSFSKSAKDKVGKEKVSKEKAGKEKTSKEKISAESKLDSEAEAATTIAPTGDAEQTEETPKTRRGLVLVGSTLLMLIAGTLLALYGGTLPQAVGLFQTRELNSNRRDAESGRVQADRERPGENQSDYRQGLEFYRQGRKQEALEALTRAIEINPGEAKAFYYRGNIRFDLGDYVNALKDYNEAIRLNPDLVEAYVNRGNVWAERRNDQNAVADYTKALERNPKLVAAYLNRCLSRSNLGDQDGAVSDCTEAISLDPANPAAYQNRGLAYRRLGMLPEAIKDFNSAIKLDAKDPDPYYNRGITRQELGDSKGAMADYAMAIELNPNHVLAYYDRGVLLAANEERDRAIQDFEKAAKLCLDSGRIACYDDAQYQLRKLRGESPEEE